MEPKRITMKNSMDQEYELGIEEYKDHIVIGRLLSEGVEKVEIPGIINEKPVTAIGDDCFFWLPRVKGGEIT